MLTPTQRFAARVRAERDARCWSQRELVEVLHALGLPGWHQTQLSKVERGTRPVTLDEAGAIAAAFGTTVGDLLDEDDADPDRHERRRAAAADELRFVVGRIDALRAALDARRRAVEP